MKEDEQERRRERKRTSSHARYSPARPPGPARNEVDFSTLLLLDPRPEGLGQGIE